MSGWSNQLSPSGIVTELFSGWPHALRPTKTAQQGMIPRHQACLMCPAHYECSQSRLVNGVIGDYARRRRTDGFRHSYSSHAGLAKRGDVSGGDRTAGRSALTHDDQARLGFVAASLAGGGRSHRGASTGTFYGRPPIVLLPGARFHRHGRRAGGR